MTKKTTTIVLGDTTKSNKYKHIKFIKCITIDYLSDAFANEGPSDAYKVPKDYNYIELICKDYSESGNSKDIMFAYDNADERSSGVLYIGYWNEGTIG